jgi:hypothetical protein
VFTNDVMACLTTTDVVILLSLPLAIGGNFLICSAQLTTSETLIHMREAVNFVLTGRLGWLECRTHPLLSLI